jgi:hypothetical protein
MEDEGVERAMRSRHLQFGLAFEHRKVAPVANQMHVTMICYYPLLNLTA